MKQETIGDRIKQLIDNFNLTVNSFSKEIKLSANTILGRIVNDPTRAPSFQVLKMMADRYPTINMNWLVTGNGEMFIGDEEVNTSRIKYFRMDRSVDMLLATKDEIDPTSIFNVSGFSDCEYAFDVIGDHMSPRFMPGEIILCKLILDSNLITGQAYLIISEEFQAIRYLKSVTEKGGFIFSSENPIYEDITLMGGMIQALCVIKGKIKRETY